MKGVFASVDGFGIQGMVLDTALIFVFVGMALIFFLYLWKKGKLDMDEEPKIQMMREERPLAKPALFEKMRDF